MKIGVLPLFFALASNKNPLRPGRLCSASKLGDANTNHVKTYERVRKKKRKKIWDAKATIITPQNECRLLYQVRIDRLAHYIITIRMCTRIPFALEWRFCRHDIAVRGGVG